MPYLCVGDDAHDLGVRLDALELSVDLLGGLRELLGVPRERLLLRLVPVLVEPVPSTKHAIGRRCRRFSQHVYK